MARVSHTRPLVLLLRMRQILEQCIPPQDKALRRSRRVISMRSANALERLLFVRSLAHARLGRSHSIISEFSVWRSVSVLCRACSGAWLLLRTGLAPARVTRLVRASPLGLVQPWLALASPLSASHRAALVPTRSLLSSRQPLRQLGQQLVAEHSFQRHQARR